MKRPAPQIVWFGQHPRVRQGLRLASTALLALVLGSVMMLNQEPAWAVCAAPVLILAVGIVLAGRAS